ncbi:AMP-dependent synthetase and ligase [Caldalkalibacillus thermarum TA2.A1]|uniref:AMP-dependent synthetase and ligase n=1 Tax=Caldalkalibacillus thermarum (strain TA2.A1) TaxID=986075 RepID=F5L9I1_CALTT|nr:long-chain fatty acid--CoA ligase [Caldalkalibacillus thermarum]EGL81968.1 AMP-dependent synthetase and ligase [Caldalkalibacillus thermarum TA2.A1]QZT34465.1 long-chain fatty acid--CoA ligase [Caldalkalibacillus thermarum TA2.A1]
MSRIAYLLEKGLQAHPDKVAIYYYETAYSYKELDRLAGQLARGLRQKLGLVPGDVLAIQSSNTMEYVLTLLACWRSGIVLTPLNPALKRDEICYQLDHSGARAFIYEAAVQKKAREALEQIQVPITPVIFQGDPKDKEHSFSSLFHKELLAPENVPGEHLALIIYTSGTTGKPKGVCLSHHNITVMAQMLIKALQLTAQDRSLLVLPLFHVNAIMCTLTAPLMEGASVVIRKRFVLEEFLPCIERYQPTYTSAVPTIYSRLVHLPEGVEKNYHLNSLRFGICGAAPMSKSLFERVEELFSFKLIEGWGLSEGTMASTLNPLDGKRKVGSIGLALPGQTVKVVDEQGQEVPRGERGELIVKGENIMVGYLNNPEATCETIKDGWLYTGDIGYQDEEGYFYIVDRKKDLIIRGGINIYPKEIEEVIYRLKEVREAAVIGVPHEDYGEEVKAYVSLIPGSSLTEEAVIAHCRKYLADYKCPKSVEFMSELPKNAVGKITKPALRALNASHQPCS